MSTAAYRYGMQNIMETSLSACGCVFRGNQAMDDYKPTWETYANHSQAGRVAAE